MERLPVRLLPFYSPIIISLILLLLAPEHWTRIHRSHPKSPGKYHREAYHQTHYQGNRPRTPTPAPRREGPVYNLPFGSLTPGCGSCCSQEHTRVSQAVMPEDIGERSLRFTCILSVPKIPNGRPFAGMAEESILMTSSDRRANGVYPSSFDKRHRACWFLFARSLLQDGRS